MFHISSTVTGDLSESGTQSSRRQLQASPPSYVVRCRSAVQLLAAVVSLTDHFASHGSHRFKHHGKICILTMTFFDSNKFFNEEKKQVRKLIPGFLIRSFLTLVPKDKGTSRNQRPAPQAVKIVIVSRAGQSVERSSGSSKVGQVVLNPRHVGKARTKHPQFYHWCYEPSKYGWVVYYYCFTTIELVII